MKYSDAVKAMLSASINTLLSNPENYAVCPEKDFSRNRKLNASNLLYLLLTMEADCIREELYRYFGRTTNAPSKAAFYKQRQKLKEDAFRFLLLDFNRRCKKNLLYVEFYIKKHRLEKLMNAIENLTEVEVKENSELFQRFGIGLKIENAIGYRGLLDGAKKDGVSLPIRIYEARGKDIIDELYVNNQARKSGV